MTFGLIASIFNLFGSHHHGSGSTGGSSTPTGDPNSVNGLIGLLDFGSRAEPQGHHIGTFPDTVVSNG